MSELDRGSPPEQEEELVEVAALELLAALVRRASSLGPGHEETVRIAEELHACLEEAGPPYRFAFFGGAAFRDGEYLPMNAASHRRIDALAGLLAARGAQQLVIEKVPSVRELIALAEVLSVRRPTPAAVASPAPGLELAPLPAGRFGDLAEPDPGEPLATTQVERAFLLARDVVEGALVPWPLAEGRGLAHCLDWAAEVSRPAAWRALELSVGAWSCSRRVAAAGLHVASVLTWIGVETQVRRAAIHAVVALAAHGLEAREGASAVDAARLALRSIAGSAPDPRFGLDGHRLRTTAILRGVAHPDGVNAENRLAPLCMLAYDLERRRCPSGLDLELTKLDLLSWVHAELGREVHPQWGRALVACHGAAPVGAHVLVDGRLGVVVSSRPGEPLRPHVLVGGELVIPKEPVRLASPLASN